MEAKKAWAIGEVPIGAVVVKDERSLVEDLTCVNVIMILLLMQR